MHYTEKENTAEINFHSLARVHQKRKVSHKESKNDVIGLLSHLLLYIFSMTRGPIPYDEIYDFCQHTTISPRRKYSTKNFGCAANVLEGEIDTMYVL